MSDFNPLIGHVFEHTDILGDTISADELPPFPEQYDLDVGSYGISAHTGDMSSDDFTVIQVIDPTEHENEYPDYADRLHKSFVLCRIYTPFLPEEGDTGWISRVKIIPVEEDQWHEVRGWITKNEYPKKPPPWMVERYDWYSDQLSKQAPAHVPKLVHCGICNSRNVLLHLERHVTIDVRAGEITKDGAVRYVAYSDEPRHQCRTSASLVCHDCRATQQLEIGEDIYDHPGSKVSQIFNVHPL